MASVTYEVEVVDPAEHEDVAFLAGVGLSALKHALNDVMGVQLGLIEVEFES